MSAAAAGAPPLRILLSAAAAADLRPRLAEVLGPRPHVVLTDTDAGEPDIAFVTRDVTGLSTRHRTLPQTQRFHDRLEASPTLRWVHIHSAGADRPVYRRLRERGVWVTTSSGANAVVVAHTAVAGVLALARRFPQLWQAQREGRWAPLIASGQPRDLEGQSAVLVGWGPIGQHIGRLLQALGLRVAVVRQQDTPAGPGLATLPFARLPTALPQADWLLLACPLTAQTQGLVDAAMLAALPPHAHLVNVARGEVVDEPALIRALQEDRLAGAFLDVFAQEPLAPDSPLWGMPNVICTPHSAGFSDGNAARVERMFLENLRRWLDGVPLVNVARET